MISIWQWLAGALFVVGVAAGAWAVIQVVPLYRAWRDRPRSTRRQRQAYRIRGLVTQSTEATRAGHARDGLRWARRALRLDPRDPEALAAAALALVQVEDWAQAIVHYERALKVNERTDCGLGVPDTFVAECSYELAVSHAELARQRNTTIDERKRHRDQAVAWLRGALDGNAGFEETLQNEPAFKPLDAEVQSLLQQYSHDGSRPEWMQP